MSRRHKETPTITTQEIHQLAEETASRAVDRAIRNETYDVSFSRFAGFEVTVKRALTKKIEHGLTQTLDGIIDIVDTPGVFVGPNSAGRPIALTLFDRFRDSDVVAIFKEIYRNTYHTANMNAKLMVESLVCFLLAMCQYTEKEHVGLVTHYYKLLAGYFGKSLLPSLRTLQSKFKWFTEFKRKTGKAAKAVMENTLYDRWMKLKQRIFGEVQTLAPAYALY